MKRSEPSRSLTGHKPHKYVPSVLTDVTRTWEKFRRLHALKAYIQDTGETEYGPMDDVDASGTFTG